MRVLALDYGSARCGCAVSDATGTIATPIEPVERAGTKAGIAEIVEMVNRLEAQVVVVGLPVSLSGGDSEQTAEARRFADRLRARLENRVPVEMYDERFTTTLAQAAGGSSSEDSRAAAVLLEEWLRTKTTGADDRVSGA